MENLIQLEDQNGNKNYPVTDVQCNLSKDDGYIKKSNGILIQWKRMTVTSTGIQWASLYYSDHIMGAWNTPFKEFYFSIPRVNSNQYWCTSVEGANLNSAGTIRVFRPTQASDTITVIIIGIGTWK